MLEFHDHDHVRVAVHYRDALPAAGLVLTIEQAGFDVVRQAHEADVVVADYETGLAMLTASRGLSRSSRMSMPAMLIVSTRSTDAEIRHALTAGAKGYLTLDCSVPELVAGVRNTFKGQRYLGAVAAGKLADGVVCELLTARELDVLRLVALGHANKAIARELDIALGTVKSHVKAILQKLDASTRTGAAAVADRRGLLNLHALTLPATSGSLVGATSACAT